MKIGIIGAGWYGCHLALKLKKSGYQVILFEKNSEIFSQISGKFGIRLHVGPHYPRSSATRLSCRSNFEKFKEEYPELIVDHDYSIYGLGDTDADGLPSKVDKKLFDSVCSELSSTKFIDSGEWGYQHLISAATIDEPSIVLGTQLREKFEQYLKSANVELVCNFSVEFIEKTDDKMKIGNSSRVEEVDFVINATSYQSFFPKESFPFDMEVVYQPCLALAYLDTRPKEKPFSFIVMDGWFPCLMPYVTTPGNNEYILTNGKWTIMGSFGNASEAYALLSSLDDKIVEDKIKSCCEQEMVKFWPDFKDRFKYIGWKGAVLAKLKTDSEFRSAVTFEKDGIIHIIPGKVSNIFDVEREVFMFLKRQGIKETKGYCYVQDGVLANCLEEITKKPEIESRSTCSLQTYKLLLENPSSNNLIFPLPLLEPDQATNTKDKDITFTHA